MVGFRQYEIKMSPNYVHIIKGLLGLLKLSSLSVYSIDIYSPEGPLCSKDYVYSNDDCNNNRIIWGYYGIFHL